MQNSTFAARLWPLIPIVGLCACSVNKPLSTEKSVQPSISVPSPHLGAVSVLTQHNSNARTGVNTAETILTPATVNNANFGELWRLPVDGQIAAQPLYVGHYTGTGKPTRNVVVVATLNNTVYAFDADSNNQTPIWTSHLHPSYASETQTDIVNNKPTGHNPQTVGIMSTPVIDATKPVAGKTAGVVYYVEMVKIGGDPENFILNEISLDDGSLVASSSLFSSFAALASIGFDTRNQLNRAGLLLSSGAIYVAFGSRYEGNVDHPYHGYVVKLDASTLAYVGSYQTTTVVGGGGIWQAGAGLAADSGGNIYFATGNGDYIFSDYCKASSTARSYSISPDTCNDPILQQTGMPGTKPTKDEDSIVKLSPALVKIGSYSPWETTHVTDRAGRDFQSMEACDSDFGSSGPILITQGTTTRLIVGGKAGQIFTLDPAAMNGSQGPSPVPNSNPELDYAPPLIQAPFQATINTSLAMGKAIQAGYGTVSFNQNCYDKSYSWGPHIHGSPVFLSSSSGDYMFVWGERDDPRRWSVAGGFITGASFSGANPNAFYSSPYTDSAPSDGMPGGALSISINGADLTTAIVWALVPSKGACGDNTECDVSASFPSKEAGIVTGDLVALKASDMSILWSTRNFHAVPASVGAAGDWSVGLGHSRSIRDYTKFVPPTIANGKVFVATSGFSLLVYGNRTLSNAQGGTGTFNWTQCTDPASLQVGDFDGDGVQDVICHHTTGTDGGKAAIAFGNSNSAAMPRTATSIMNLGFCFANSFTPSPALYVGDFDGDGRSDLLCHDFSTGAGGSGHDWILYSNGGATAPFPGASWGPSSYDPWCQGPDLELVIGDFNGDGRSDILCHDKVNPSSKIEIRTAQAQPARFDQTHTWSTDNSNWCYDPVPSNGSTWHDHLLAADVDGDGLDDLICHNPFNGFKYISYSKANRVVAATAPVPTFGTSASGARVVTTDWSFNLTWCTGLSSSGVEIYQFGLADINGDGAADMWCHNRDSSSPDMGKTYVMYGHPRTRGTPNVCGSTAPYNCTTGGTSDWVSSTSSCKGNITAPPVFVVGDFDGDNRADFLCHDNSGASCSAGKTNCVSFYPF